MSSSIMRFIGILCVLGLSALSSAQVNLGAAQSYGILGKSTVTNTGNTTIVGDLGTGGSSITGQASLVVTGRIVIGDETLTAFSDAGAAYTAINGFGPSLLPGMELGGLVLSPGVYRFTSSAQLTGTLTLNGTGSPNDAWYFQIASTLTTAPDAAVVFIGGGTPCNVYWTVGTSATIDERTSFAGTILASASVTFNGNAVLLGRAIGLTGAVTMISNAIVVTNNCPVSSSSTSTTLASSTPPVGPPAPTDLYPIATTPLIPSGSPLSQGPGGQIPPSVTAILPNPQSSDTSSRTVSATTSLSLLTSSSISFGYQTSTFLDSAITTSSLATYYSVSFTGLDVTTMTFPTFSESTTSGVESASSTSGDAVGSESTRTFSGTTTESEAMITNSQLFSASSETISALNSTVTAAVTVPFFSGSVTIQDVITVKVATISTLTSCPHKATCTGQTSTWTGSEGPLPCPAHTTCSCVLPGGTKTVTELITLTSCPLEKTCTGQTSTWTGTGGPLPCSAGESCSCVLPGGTQTATTCPTSCACSGQTTKWTGSNGPTTCAAGVTCNWVLPSTGPVATTESQPPSIPGGMTPGNSGSIAEATAMSLPLTGGACRAFGTSMGFFVGIAVILLCTL
ncbi:hypothetical protein LZ554_004117 [Drepanopeziza brunnea f. sp. 'monogermtubi']|nr:hypothetical protein LZ554_004117 [Drepanopeziza brunnea f. sp. 'monogermtubi']